MSNQMIFSNCFINRFLNMPMNYAKLHMDAIRHIKGDEYAECFLEKLHETIYMRNLGGAK